MNEPLGPMALVLLLIPAVALRIAIRALYGRKRLAAADPMQMLLSLSSAILFSLAGLGLIVGLMGLWLLMIPLPIAFIILVLMLIDRTRRSEHRALIWSLAAAAQKGVPLSEAARAYADETLGDTGVRALALAESIERGEPLAEAVRYARLRMGSAMKLAVRLGERLGMLGPAMRQQLSDSNQLDATLNNAITRLFYVAMIIFVLQGVMVFVMLKIVPVFQRMFAEFDMEMPAVTNLVINLSSWFARVGWIFMLPTVVPVMLALLLAGLLHYVGWLPRGIPLWWSLFKRYDGALVMRGLALGVRQRWPLPEALRLVADSYPLAIVSSRVRRAADSVAKGQEWTVALQRTGLIGQADAAVLAAAQRAGNLEWALEEMADSALRRLAHWVQALIQTLFPLALLTLSLFVMIFVVGLFMPLISLIQGLV